jgi:CreA protein
MPRGIVLHGKSCGQIHGSGATFPDRHRRTGESQIGGSWESLMPSRLKGLRSAFVTRLTATLLTGVVLTASQARAADEPDLIFRRSTVFKLLSPNDKLATYGVDDPEVEGVACHFTVPEKGGFKGWLGLAEEVSDISLACRQVGPIRFKDKMDQGDDMFRKRRSLFFKKMQIVRGCDSKRNVLVYMVYSDKLIEGSPKNSTSTVPVMPWGASDTEVQKCSDFIQ